MRTYRSFTLITTTDGITEVYRDGKSWGWYSDLLLAMTAIDVLVAQGV